MLEFRSFRSGDGEAVWRLHDAALDDAGVHGGHGPWEDDLRDICTAYLDSGGDFMVALVDGEMVGIGGLMRCSKGVCEIKRMRVHPDFQRQGVGRLMLEKLEERAQALGCHTVRLDTTEEQIAARRLYESAGYESAGRRNVGRFVFLDFTKTLRVSDGAD